MYAYRIYVVVSVHKQTKNKSIMSRCKGAVEWERFKAEKADHRILQSNTKLSQCTCYLSQVIDAESLSRHGENANRSGYEFRERKKVSGFYAENTSDRQNIKPILMEIVNREKEKVNRGKEKVNRGKEKVNREKEKVNRGKEKVNRGKEKVNRGKEKVNRGKEKFHRGKGKVNLEKEKVNRGKGKVNRGTLKEDDAGIYKSPCCKEEMCKENQNSGSVSRNFLGPHNISHRLCKCATCGKGFCRLRDLHTHSVQHQKCSDKHSLTQNHHVIGKLFRCFHCGRGYNRSKDLTFHLKHFMHLEDIKFETDVLENYDGRTVSENIDKFRSAKTNIKWPKKLKLENKPKVEIKPEADVGSTVFEHIDTFRSTKRNIFTRDCCNIQKHNRIRPKPKFENKPKIKCEICRRKFKRHNLKAHARVHSGVKPFRCVTCGKTFSQLGNMKIHTRVHTNVRPYACPYCPLRFKQLSQVQVHYRLHKTGRGVLCNRCGAVFGHKFFLNKHICS